MTHDERTIHIFLNAVATPEPDKIELVFLAYLRKHIKEVCEKAKLIDWMTEYAPRNLEAVKQEYVRKK